MIVIVETTYSLCPSRVWRKEGLSWLKPQGHNCGERITHPHKGNTPDTPSQAWAVFTWVGRWRKRRGLGILSARPEVKGMFSWNQVENCMQATYPPLQDLCDSLSLSLIQIMKVTWSPFTVCCEHYMNSCESDSFLRPRKTVLMYLRTLSTNST